MIEAQLDREWRIKFDKHLDSGRRKIMDMCGRVPMGSPAFVALLDTADEYAAQSKLAQITFEAYQIKKIDTQVIASLVSAQVNLDIIHREIIHRKITIPGYKAALEEIGRGALEIWNAWDMHSGNAAGTQDANVANYLYEILRDL